MKVDIFPFGEKISANSMQYMMRYTNGYILFLLALIFSQCDFYPDGCDVCSVNAAVQGNIINFDSTGFANTYIRISVFPDSCNSDSTVSGGTAVQNSGSYRYIYQSPIGESPATYYKALLIRVSSSPPVVLDGTKEFEMPPLKADDPYNKVEVNFTFPDLLS